MLFNIVKCMVDEVNFVCGQIAIFRCCFCLFLTTTMNWSIVKGEIAAVCAGLLLICSQIKLKLDAEGDLMVFSAPVPLFCVSSLLFGCLYSNQPTFYVVFPSCASIINLFVQLAVFAVAVFS